MIIHEVDQNSMHAIMVKNDYQQILPLVNFGNVPRL